MNESQQVLYRLVGDVAALKRDAEIHAKSQEVAWGKIDKIKDSLEQVNCKLDQVVSHEDRLKKVEATAEDYRTTKNRVMSIILGAGVSAGGFGGAVTAWFSKWFNGQ